ncbi:hypothetical protein Ptr902_03856 [Pyrenophora tritici-repentis]|nr:hypothetical protein PtrV1_07605 [Pyrenophora tritici-repentis]KAF7448662.1 hypothetical protein A1F99_080260 [Pyrenophora tritici-repentis]KAI0569615.1 hypothetical protein Alg215_11535 [Pyrenophora tritici-repentis]KAI0576367.1 hypothetical protein Alg130_08823 [Pyrenophora tritici-repentis]KAI0607000.1 hypothetical protein TUN205_08764 [Pyrenophora tritici-repentis]
MLSLFKFASLAALLGLAAAQQQPCYNAADPQDGVGSYCRCADNRSSSFCVCTIP